MRYYFLIISMLFLIGCGEDRFFLVPSADYSPTFKTSDFKQSKPFTLEGWEETDLNNTYIVTPKLHFLDFTKDAKTDKSKYNLLLKKIREFNLEIEKQNEYQKNRKPQEIETYNAK